MESIGHPEKTYWAVPSRIFNDRCETNFWQYWLAPDHTNNVHILFDMQVTNMITTVTLKQTTHNGHYTRGVADFDIHVGNDTASLTTLATSGLLLNVNVPNQLACEDIPLQRFHVGYIARYVKFTAKTHHITSAGLKYIKFE